MVTMDKFEIKEKNSYLSEELVAQINPQNVDLISCFLEKWRVVRKGRKRRLKYSSRGNYKNELLHLFAFILQNYHNKFLLDFTDEETIEILEDFIAFCVYEFKNAPYRIRRRLNCISSFYQFLLKNKQVIENPTGIIGNITRKEGLYISNRVFLIREQIEKIRYYMEKDKANLNIKLFFELSIFSMARPNVLANIKMSQIDFDNGIIRNISNKDGYVLDIPYNKICEILILELINERKKKRISTEYLFFTKFGGSALYSMENNWTNYIGKIINSPNLVSDDLRHSACKLKREAGMDIETLSKLLYFRKTDDSENYEKYYKEAIKKKYQI